VSPDINLATILCCHHTRKVSRDNTVRYRWRTLQLLPDSSRKSYVGTHVLIREYNDGKLEVVSDAGIIIASEEAPHKPNYFIVSSQQSEHDRKDIPQWLEVILRQKNDTKEPQMSDLPLMRHPTIRQQTRWDAVKEARSRGLSERATASLLAMSRKTVKKYKSTVSPPLYHPRINLKMQVLAK